MPITTHQLRPGIAEVVIDHPPVNALDVAGWFGLAAAVTDAGRVPDNRVVIVRAEGRGFCAGVDIKEIQARGDEALIGANRGCFAAFAAVGESVVHPAKYYQNNFVNTLALRVDASGARDPAAAFDLERRLRDRLAALQTHPDAVAEADWRMGVLANRQAERVPAASRGAWASRALQSYELAYALAQIPGRVPEAIAECRRMLILKPRDGPGIQLMAALTGFQAGRGR